MDFYSDSTQTPNQNQISANTPSGFSIAAIICGVLSLICCCTGILAIPVGSLGIIFAVLTKRKGSGMPLMSTIGIWLCCVGMALGILLTVYSFMVILSDPAMLEQLMTDYDIMFEAMYGMTFEEYINSLVY